MDRIVLKRAVFNITTKCNLKCKLCVMQTPYLKDKPEHSLEMIRNTSEEFFKVVDYVEWMEFSGGETFLHKDLYEMTKEVLKYKKQYGKLLFITNGTIIPNDNLLNLLESNKDIVLLQISHYGEVSKNADMLKQICDERKIECQVKKYFGDDQHLGGWIDYGDYHCYNRSVEELEDIYSKCGCTKMEGNWTIHFGKMYWCVPSAIGMHYIHKIPDAPDDYVDFWNREESVNEKRRKIRNMMNKTYIQACNYCSGHFGSDDPEVRYPAGVQLM